MPSLQQIEIAPAEIVSQQSYQAPGRLLVTEHTFRVPLSHASPTSGDQIELFARSARRVPSSAPPSSWTTTTRSNHNDEQIPWICYLQGGPGHPCGSPGGYGFTDALLDRGYQVLLLDQRGTGLSTPMTASTLAQRGGDTAGSRADYLALFRADSIVRDCEAIRLALTSSSSSSSSSQASRPSVSSDSSTGPEATKAGRGPGPSPEHHAGGSSSATQLESCKKRGEKWSIMGQSFGGFVSTTYLSLHPEGLHQSFIFGGLPPLVDRPDEVYRRLFRKVKRRNEIYYGKHQEDVERVKEIVRFLEGREVRLPGGGRLTGRLFLSLGLGLGMHGGVDQVHDHVLKASRDLSLFGHLTRNTLSGIESSLGWENNVLYALIHEPIYNQSQASEWSAHRVMTAEYPDFGILSTQTPDPLLFTGEMIFPWMFDDCPELARMKDVAELVAAKSDWPALYDRERLRKNEVPVYAAAYTEDMYVDFEFSKETAAAINRCKMFSTNVMYHNAVRAKCKEVVDQLFALRDDVID